MARGQLWILTVGVCSTMKGSHPKSPPKLFHVYSTNGRAESGEFLRATRIDPFIVKPKKDRWPFLLSCSINQAHAPHT